MIPLLNPPIKKSTSVKQNSANKELYISKLIVANRQKTVLPGNKFVSVKIFLFTAIHGNNHCSWRKVLIKFSYTNVKKRPTSFEVTLHRMFRGVLGEAELS